MSVAKYAHLVNRTDQNLYKLIKQEELKNINDLYGPAIEPPPRLGRNPRLSPPAEFLETSAQVDDNWNTIEELIDILLQIKLNHGNTELDFQESDWESTSLVYTLRVPNPKYAAQKIQYDKLCEIWDNYHTNYANYQQTLSKWLANRNKFLLEIRDKRIAYWNSIYTALIDKHVKAIEHAKTRRVHNNAISYEICGYNVRLHQIQLLLAKYPSSF